MRVMDACTTMTQGSELIQRCPMGKVVRDDSICNRPESLS